MRQGSRPRLSVGSMKGRHRFKLAVEGTGFAGKYSRSKWGRGGKDRRCTTLGLAVSYRKKGSGDQKRESRSAKTGIRRVGSAEGQRKLRAYCNVRGRGKR